jgi:hypothetical protein
MATGIDKKVRQHYNFTIRETNVIRFLNKEFSLDEMVKNWYG